MRCAAAISTFVTATLSSTPTHSSTACAPSPLAPNITVGMPAAAMKAASAQYGAPAIAGGEPRISAAVARCGTISASRGLQPGGACPFDHETRHLRLPGAARRQ
jgi:hypothetical protein